LIQFKNCFQCVAYLWCYQRKKIDLQTAREKAEQCDKQFKGKGTDLVNIIGTTKCISLKKAFKFLNQEKVIFEDFHLVKFWD